MHIRIAECTNEQFIFSLYQGDTSIFRSCDPLFPFFGRYGAYNSEEEVRLGVRDFLFRNGSFLQEAQIPEETPVQDDQIRARVLSKFIERLKSLVEFYEYLGQKDRDPGDVASEAQVVKGFLDQDIFLTENMARFLENEQREEQLDEEFDLDELFPHGFRSEYAKNIMAVNIKMRKLRRKVKRDFINEAQAVSTILGKIAKTNPESEDWVRNILMDYGKNVVDVLGGGAVNKVCMKDDGYDIVVSSPTGGEVVLSVNKNLIPNQLVCSGEMGNLCPYMSRPYYEDLWYPLFLKNDVFLIDNDIVITPEPIQGDLKIGYQEDGSYVKDIFSGYEISSGRVVPVTAKLLGDSPRRVCAFTHAASEPETMDMSIERRYRQIMSSYMAKITREDSKYNGVAGTILHEQVAKMPGYIVVPLTVTWDTGLTETVSFTDDDIEIYA